MSKFVREYGRRVNQKPSFTIFNHVWPGDGPGSGGGWHRDTRLKPVFKIIFYLVDVFPGGGEFFYVKGSHKFLSPSLLLRWHELLNKPRYEKFSKLLDPFGTGFSGRMGDAVLANTTGLHKGSEVFAGERFALTVYFDNGVMIEK